MPELPMISIANLVEYAASNSAVRRRNIIEQYQDPKIYFFDWHGASDAIFNQRARGLETADSLLDAERERVKKMLCGDAKKDVRPKHILEMIEHLETSDLARVAHGASPEDASMIATDMLLGGIKVRIRPNLVLKRDRLGKKRTEYG